MQQTAAVILQQAILAYEIIEEIDLRYRKQLQEENEKLDKEKLTENYLNRGNVYLRLRMYDEAGVYASADERPRRCSSI